MFSDALLLLCTVALGLLGVTGPVYGQSVSLDNNGRASGAVVGHSPVFHTTAASPPVDRSDFQSMPQLVDNLLEEITRLSNFRKPDTRPHVTRVSRAEIERTICDGPCAVKGWYLPDEGIFLDDTLTPETNLIHRSILFHELVHFVQEANGEAAALDPCHRWVEREVQAYELQNKYLALLRDTSTFMQVVSNQARLVSMRTVCRGSNRSAGTASQVFKEGKQADTPQ